MPEKLFEINYLSSSNLDTKVSFGGSAELALVALWGVQGNNMVP